MYNTFSGRRQEFLSPVFSIIVVQAFVQLEAGFMFVKGREGKVVQKSQITGRKKKKNVSRPDV